MAEGSNSPFSATGSLLGYLYQVRYGLWAALQAHPVSGFAISFEILDDVAFEPLAGLGDPAVLFQTKHHLNRAATITDSSPDLWRTIRVWAEVIKTGPFPDGSVLNLVTTAVAPAGSVAALLRPGSRDVATALTKTEEICRTSMSKENAAAYAAFMAVESKQRRRLLDAIVVLDAQPSVADLDAELRKQVRWACEGKDQGPFLQRLEGWWYRRVIRQLERGHADRILSDELEGQMNDLREGFKRDALPVDTDIVTLELNEGTRAAHSSSRFVRQLELIRATQERIRIAILDYYRAFEQRSRWVREDLLLLDDVSRYERALVDEWNICFERIKNELGADAAEEGKCAAARQVLSWAETAVIPLRRVTTPFVTRGSLHMLADEIRIGWHPDFRDRLASLLAATGAT